MEYIAVSIRFVLFSLLNLFLCFLHVHGSNNSVIPNSRQALEIIIGVGIGGSNNQDCPPPPAPESRPPPALRAPPPTPKVPTPVHRARLPARKRPPAPSLKAPQPAPKTPSLPKIPPVPSLGAPQPAPKAPPLPPSPGPSQPLIFLDQRLAVVYPVIQKFKNLITSDPLNITKSWVGADICKYQGFFCDTPPDNSSATALASIDFNGFQLSAPSLNGFLDQLPDIALFHANSNNFAGTISPKVATLQYLYELDVSNNKLSGPFPTFLLNQSFITFLDIRFNFFTGSVPPQIFNQNFEALFINNNNFMQKLPDNLGSTTVFYLTLANNKFVGTIPRSIGKASSTLIEVLFLNNQLSGCLPYEIGYLKELVVFDVGQNRLTGQIPCSFGCLQKIEQLNLAGNMLYGMVPEVICELGNLANLSLSGNYFTQVGPICWGLIQSGVLDLRKNCVPGLPYQRSIMECAMFFAHRHKFCGYALPYSYIPCELPHAGKGGSGRKGSPSEKNLKAPSLSDSALLRHRL